MTMTNPLPENTVQQSALLGRLILDRQTTDKIGQVKEFWSHADLHQVTAIVAESGFLGHKVQYLRWAQVDAIGEDSVLVSLSADASGEPPKGSEVVIGHELWTDAGNQVGKLTDYCFDLQTGAITAYLFMSNGWQGIADGIYMLMPQAVVSIGAQRVIAQEALVKASEQFSEGLKGRLNQVTEFFREDYAQTMQDMAALKATGQSTVAQVQAKTQEATEQVQEVTQQATTAAQSLIGDAQSRLQQTAHDMATQIQEKTKTAQSQLEEDSTVATDGDRSEETSSEA